MTDFRDAIARALHAKTHDDDGIIENPATCQEREGWVGHAYINYDGCADALLATPEMQAIRAALRMLAQPYHHHTARSVLTQAYDLPESVVAWVLGDNP